jgi:hypothetical protein
MGSTAPGNVRYALSDPLEARGISCSVSQWLAGKRNSGVEGHIRGHQIQSPDLSSRLDSIDLFHRLNVLASMSPIGFKSPVG